MSTSLRVIFDRTVSIVVVILLPLLLLWGDGKQSLVDVLAAMGIIVLFIFDAYNKFFSRKISKDLQIAWVIMLGVLLIGMAFSESVGYSFSDIVRWLEAYLLFYFFYVHAKETYVYALAKILALLTIVGLLILLALYFLPEMVKDLPLMNLLYPIYGHNHIVDLLVFVFPLAISWCLTRFSWKSCGFLILVIGGVILASARGALILLAVYLLWQYFFYSHPAKRAVLVSVSAVFISLILVGGVFQSLPSSNKVFFSSWLEKQTSKPALTRDIRFRYWSQAVTAIKARPLLGGGPGTFYLQSKRYQLAPNSYSWFAHSFPLQVAAETGFVGLVFFGILCLVVVRNLRKAKTILVRKPILYYDYWLPLLQGVILTFIYSFYEYNLNFLLVWLIFWSTIAILLGTADQKYNNLEQKWPFFTLVNLGGLSLFWLTAMAAMLSSLFSLTRNFSYWFMPFDKEKMVTILNNFSEKKKNPQKWQLGTIIFFHRNNPEILFAIARDFSAWSDYETARRYYSMAIQRDPKNIDYHVEYLNFLITQKKSPDIYNEVKALGYEFLPPSLQQSVIEASQTVKGIPVGDLVPPLMWSSVGPEQVRLYLAKAYYFLGLAVIDSDPQSAASYWNIAALLNPSLSYYHVELAHLYASVFFDRDKAISILKDCEKIRFAQNHCQQALESFSAYNPKALLPVGFFAKEIRDFSLL